MQHILVVEDYPLVAKRIRRFLGAVLNREPDSFPWCEDLEHAEQYLAQHPVDLLFLDLNLGGADGFDLLKHYTAGNFETIIVSANTARALEAFEYGVVDFVAKPFDQERLAAALSRVTTRAKRAARYLSVKKHGSIQLVDIDDIYAVKGEGNYAELWTRAGDKPLHAKTLDQLLRILPEHFHRVHKSYILNIIDVASLQRPGAGRYSALLKNGEEIPIGRSRWPDISALFEDRLPS